MCVELKHESIAGKKNANISAFFLYSYDLELCGDLLVNEGAFAYKQQVAEMREGL